MKKIIIVTLFSVPNYGTVLQAYATQKILTSLGYSNKILNYTQKRLKFVNVTKNSYKNLKNIRGKLYAVCSIGIRTIPNIIFKNKFRKFIKDYLVLTKEKFNDINQVKSRIPDADVYITGSDQVWNSNYNGGIDEVYYLTFVSKEKKKLAYSASLGMDDFKKEEKEAISKLLQQYNSLSVRELSACENLKKLGFESKVVLDPTLLLNDVDWKKIEKEKKVKEKYLLVYILGRDKDILNYAFKIAFEKKLKIVKIGLDFLYSKKVYKNIQYASPRQFIYLFRHAEYIITNSFHGIAFSINFNKQFEVILPKTYDTRLRSILSIFRIENRLISTKSHQLLPDIDYDIVNKKLEELRKDSIEFLKNSIEK